jgi:hypothetical protein
VHLLKLENVTISRLPVALVAACGDDTAVEQLVTNPFDSGDIDALTDLSRCFRPVQLRSIDRRRCLEVYTLPAVALG